MKNNVLLVGYGSIGRRHVRNLIGLGIKPYVLTRHPDNTKAEFIDDIKELKNIKIGYCIISSSTARHLDDLLNILKFSNSFKNMLIEKPLECSYVRGKKIQSMATLKKLHIFVAYNLRFLRAFNFIRRFIREQGDKIRIVEVVAGQDLKEWRPDRDLRESYSASRGQGGGVDLDLSHEIDYIFWLFGNKLRNKFIYRTKVSNLQITSPDVFKAVLDYKSFLLDITLDYIRKPKERYLRIICECSQELHCDFISGIVRRKERVILGNNNDMDRSYQRMLKAFLGIDKKNRAKLCTLGEALNILKFLAV